MSTSKKPTINCALCGIALPHDSMPSFLTYPLVCSTLTWQPGYRLMATRRTPSPSAMGQGRGALPIWHRVTLTPLVVTSPKKSFLEDQTDKRPGPASFFLYHTEMSPSKYKQSLIIPLLNAAKMLIHRYWRSTKTPGLSGSIILIRWERWKSWCLHISAYGLDQWGCIHKGRAAPPVYNG